MKSRRRRIRGLTPLGWALVAIVVCALYVGYVVHCNAVDIARFERAQALSELPTVEQITAAIARNERAMEMDHLPTSW